MAETTKARTGVRNHTRPPGLSPERAHRIIRACKSPAAASRAAERVYRLSRQKSAQAGALLALSEALHEQRHVLLATWRDDLEGAAEHARNVRESVRRACEVRP
jgi:hypothetical protein